MLAKFDIFNSDFSFLKTGFYTKVKEISLPYYLLIAERESSWIHIFSLREMQRYNDERNQEKIITFGEKENYKYLGILEADTIKQAENQKSKKEYLRRTRTLLETKLCCRNLIKGRNT